MRRVLFACVAIALSSIVVLPARQGATPSPAGQLTIDTLLHFKHPSEAVWSPDGRQIAFLWDESGVQNIFVVPADGSAKPRALTSYTDAETGAPTWATRSDVVYFARDGRLWQVSVAGAAEPSPVWANTSGEGGFSFSPDGTRVAFTRQNDLWIRPLAGGSETRLTNTPEGESRATWSPDGSMLAYTTGTTIRHADPAPYVGAKLLFAWFERKSGDMYVIPSTGGEARVIAPGPMRKGMPRWIDAKRLVFDRFSDDTTTREIVVADASTGQGTVIHRDVDQKWWSIPGQARPGPIPSPKGDLIAFVADTDGWDHIYVARSDLTAPVATQVTKGRFEAWRPTWSPDGTRIAFDGNTEAAPGTRQLGVITLSGPDRATLTVVTAGDGTNIGATWSPDGRALLYQHTDAQNSADLFVVRTQPPAGSTPVRLSESMPAGIDRTAFVKPQFVKYTAPDGQQVPAWLFVPSNLDRTRKHPVVVWVHGDGINQNFDGWHVERNYAVYYSFHQYLLQHGYIVIAPDYRGSIGYGRDWREGAFMEVGGADFRDLAAVASYVKTLPYADPNRIGVWGLSYGGFFTLLALTDTPTSFACAVDVAGVVDYRMYYTDPYKGGWTYGRIRSPEEAPKAYDVASPLSRADKIVRPLLILHGTSDVNVPYLESVRLVDTLLKLGKPFDFATYPGEFHYFQRAHVLRDAWTRVEQFFNAHLAPERAAAPGP